MTKDLTFQPFLDHILDNFDMKTKMNFLKMVDSQTIRKVFKLPGSVIKKFFDNVVIKLHEEP